MEGSSIKKPLTGYEMEDMFGSKKPNLLPSSSSSSSKPPLGPVPLLLKKPNSNSIPLSAIEAVITGNNSQKDKNEQFQTPYESSAQNNNNKNIIVPLNVASSEQYHLEAKNQHEPTTKVSDPSEEARRLRRVMLNRMSAQRSRFRKHQHVANLERQYAELKNQISSLKPQIEELANLKDMLMLEQTSLVERFDALENETLLKQAEIERNQAEVYELRELEKLQKETEAQAMMMNFANWDALPNDQEIFVNTDSSAQGFENIEEMSGIEEDEQTMNLNNFFAINELDAIVNPPKPSDKNADSSKIHSSF